MKKLMVAVSCVAMAIAGFETKAADCSACCKKDPIVGSWAMFLPYEAMNAGHMIVTRDASGKLQVSMLLRDSSPLSCTIVKAEGNTFSFKSPRADGVVVEGTVEGDTAKCKLTELDKDGKVKFGPKDFTCKRNPPIDPKASTKNAKFGEPIDLLAEGLDGFEGMDENDPEDSWNFEDGVLANRIKRTLDGRKIPGVNLITKRKDFLDFKLDFDVRLTEGGNSGVYLCGRYEIQILDSFGKPVDCHNMGALYGRIAPTVAAEKKAGEWQHMTVTLYKRHITVVLNGQTIIDDQPVEGITGGAMDADEFKPGPMYIQGDHSDADFRNMILRPAL